MAGGSFIERVLGTRPMVEAGKIVQSGADIIKTVSNKEQASERQRTDMYSDSPLSKNIRPIIAIWAMVLFSVYLIANSRGVKFDEQTGDTVFWLIIVVMGFYFPGRTLEKYFSRKK